MTEPLHLSRDPATVKIDPGQLAQVIMNLAVNVLTDVVMPGMSGPTLARKVREVLDSAPALSDR